MFCPNCGAQNDENNYRCVPCGFVLHPAGPARPAGGRPRPAPTSGMPVWLIVLIVVGGGGLILVVVMGILAAIAIPKFADLTRRSSEGSTKASLASMKAALAIYYGDMEGSYPADARSLTVSGKYLAAIPKAKTPNFHLDSTNIRQGPEADLINDDGGWAYANTAGEANHGTIWVNCTHTDSKGSVWTSY